MRTDGAHSTGSLAARRKALIAQCGQQRVDAASAARALLPPVGAGSLKVPLTIAGVVLGMIAARPGRALPMITAGLSLWKLARSVLSVLRRPTASE
jgi:hypothetical protein